MFAASTKVGVSRIASPEPGSRCIHPPRPQIPFGSGFARGWRSLPCELKVQILKDVFADEQEDYDASDFRRSSIRGSRHPAGFELLHSSKEIADLAGEVLYGRGTFELNAPEKNFRPILFPPKVINHFIRRLQIVVCLCRRDFAFLARLADGNLGFGNLLDIHISIDANIHQLPRSRPLMDNVAYTIAGHTLAFCARNLCVVFLYPNSLPLHAPLSRAKFHITRMAIAVEPLLSEYFTIRRDGETTGPTMIRSESSSPLGRESIRIYRF